MLPKHSRCRLSVWFPRQFLPRNTQMRAVRSKVIKIIKEFVILHDCLSFSVFLAGIMCHIIHHFAPLVKRMVSMIAIYIFDARVSYEAINRSRKKTRERFECDLLCQRQ